MSKIKLVQNDTGPALVWSLTDQTSGAPIDLSPVGATANLIFYPATATGTSGAAAGVLTLALTLLPGLQSADGSITLSAPYNVAGAGGRVTLPSWPTGSLATPGDYVGEIQTTINGVTQTVYDLMYFTIRPL